MINLSIYSNCMRGQSDGNEWGGCKNYDQTVSTINPEL